MRSECRTFAAATRKAPDMVLGISLEGMVAMRFAARHPELTRRLVILISAHRFSQSGEHIMERQFRALEQGDLPTWCARTCCRSAGRGSTGWSG